MGYASLFTFQLHMHRADGLFQLLDFDHTISGRVFCDQGRTSRFRSLSILRSEATNNDPEVLLVDDAQDSGALLS